MNDPRSPSLDEVRGDVVRVPADFEHGLSLFAGVVPRPGQQPIYDADGPIAIEHLGRRPR